MSRHLLASLATLTAVGAIGPSNAVASEALATKYTCVACHQPQSKVVGPSWTEIATKYRGGSKSAADLAKSIRAGSTGQWGPVPMPAQAQVPEADAAAIAAWILTIK